VASLARAKPSLTLVGLSPRLSPSITAQLVEVLQDNLKQAKGHAVARKAAAAKG
jgi:hypothetical protein